MSNIFHTDGIVLKTFPCGDSGLYLKLLTPERGIIDVTARGVKKQNASNKAVSQLFCAASYSISISKGRYYLNSGEIKSSFFGISGDIERLALASYMSEVLQASVTENQSANDIYRLVANTFYMLAKGALPAEQLKFIFEMRLMGDIGFLPDVVGCAECYKTEKNMYFLPLEEKFYCHTHAFAAGYGEDVQRLPLTDSALEAMRFVLFTPIERLFNFKLADRSLKQAAAASENYLLCRMERGFQTLDIYKGLIQFHPQAINITENT